MKRSDLVADLRRYCGGGGFITRQGLAAYLGYADPHRVDYLLSGLGRVNNKLYFIGDIADALKGGESCGKA